jgi:hypothetical protein
MCVSISVYVKETLGGFRFCKEDRRKTEAGVHYVNDRFGSLADILA